jgi:hypothetical protein
LVSWPNVFWWQFDGYDPPISKGKASSGKQWEILPGSAFFAFQLLLTHCLGSDRFLDLQSITRLIAKFFVLSSFVDDLSLSSTFLILPAYHSLI